MKYEEIQRLFKACRTLGIKTLSELSEFKLNHNCNSNDELLNELEMFKGDQTDETNHSKTITVKQLERQKQYDRYNRAPNHDKKYGNNWKRIRGLYVKKHPLCERCLKEGRITPVEEVHHIVPLSRGGTNQFSNLMSLCQSCHTIIHYEIGDRS